MTSFDPTSLDEVIELRQYTLKPGKRDTLIELFDREFVEAQEDAGMRIIGQFCDLDDPDRFVWIRSFADMHSRPRALSAFYGGPIWKANREVANATMVDSDNVLLLRPVRPHVGFPIPPKARPALDNTQPPSSVITVTMCHLPVPPDEGFIQFIDDHVLPTLASAGARPIALLETEPARNNFPALPVREGENVVAWFCAFNNVEQHERHLDRLAGISKWQDDVAPRLRTSLISSPEGLRLAPTARSALR